MGGLRRDVEAGLARATGDDLLVDASVGFARSAFATGAATLLGPLGLGAAIALTTPLQLGATHAVAGRLLRRRAAG